MKSTIPIKAELPVGTIEILRRLAEARNITLEEALIRAIATAGVVEQSRKDGSKLWEQTPNNTVRELALLR